MSLTAKALWYIESRLGGDLTLESISQDLQVSRFHLCRAFGVSLGLPLAVYVRSRRLSEAARSLADGAPCITSVALDFGYGSHEAFTRAFRQQFGLTPEQVRAQADVTNLNLQEPIRMQPNVLPSIASPKTADREAILIFGISQNYSCKQLAGIPSQWDRFLPHFGHIPGQVGKVAYGVIYNSDDAGNIDYMCGVEVPEFPSYPEGFGRLRIPPQTYAVFEHRGHISAIGSTWNAVWNRGLAEAGFKATDGPAFERYDEEFDGQTGNGRVELWVPVQR